MVRDTGIGIPENKLPYIFDRYFQAHNDKDIKGTGIGLALVKELVEVQRGNITAENYSVPASNTQSKITGAIFTVTLPYKIAEDIRQEINTEIQATDDSKDRRVILVVEDNKELAEYIIGNISQYYNVHYAENGNIAINIALTTVPDLIISDVLMGDTDGFSLCTQLKNNSSTSHIPIILLTAKSDMLKGFVI